MNPSNELALEFTLAPAALRFSVEVQLRRAGERWIALATIGGQRQTGIGATPRAALAAALDQLSTLAVTILMADTGLLEPSIAIASMATG